MRRGWFEIPGLQRGDRTVKQQLRGLGRLVAMARGKRIVDFGCAEGLIDKELLDNGAAYVRGYEVIAEHLDVANRVCADYAGSPERFEFCHQNLNDFAALSGGGQRWDIAVMLAILHKLKRPDDFLDTVVREFAPQHLVIRTAGRTPGYVKDERGDNRTVQLLPFLAERGYAFEERRDGPFDEWTGYFSRSGG